MRKNTVEDFWIRVNKNGPIHPVLGTPCWLWTGALYKTGYGQIRMGGKTVRIHRYAWKVVAGRDIPEGHGVLHHCDVRHCVNYEQHLFTGTDTTNMRDAAAKGRMTSGDRHHARLHPECLARGVKHGMAKLDEERVSRILADAARGASYRALAAREGVHPITIRSVVLRHTWRHVPLPTAILW